MIRSLRHVGLALLIATPAIGAPPDVPCYVIETLPALDGQTSAAYGLNDVGDVVGSSETKEGTTHAVRWDAAGTLTDLGTLGGVDAIAFDVNGSGQITGLITFDFGVLINRSFRWTAGTTEILDPLPLDSASVGRAISDDGRVVGTSIEFDLLRAVIWNAASAFDLGTINGPQADAWGINNQGDMVGWSNNISTGFFGRRAFLSTGGSAPQDLGTLGAFYAWAFDVNEQVDVVGESGLTTGAIHAFLWRGGTMNDLGTLTPIADWSRAHAVNDQMQVVGWSRLAPLDATTRAFLWQGGAMHDLNDRVVDAGGWVLTEAWDISETGVIVGIGELNGADRAFRLTPTVLAADVDDDCTVNINDLLAVLGAWGACPPAGGCPGDVDEDGVVGIGDLLMVLGEWSQS